MAFINARVFITPKEVIICQNKQVTCVIISSNALYYNVFNVQDFDAIKY